MQIDIYHRAAALPDAWNEHFTPRHPFAHRYWLTFLEQTIADYQPTYLLGRVDGRAVVGAALYPQHHFYLASTLPNSVRRLALGLLSRRPPLRTALPLLGTSGLFVASPTAAEAHLPSLCRALREFASRNAAPFWVVDNVLADEQAMMNRAGELLWLTLDPETQLALPHADFETHLASLSRTRRRYVRRVRRHAEEAGVTVRAGTLAAQPDLARLAQLQQNVSQQHGNPHPYSAGYLARASQLLEDDNHLVLTAYQEGALIGSITLFHTSGIGLAKWPALDYPRTEPSHAYHFLVCEGVRYAIELGLTTLMLGPTVYTLKRQLGAQLRDRYLALATRPAMLARGVRALDRLRQATVK